MWFTLPSTTTADLQANVGALVGDTLPFIVIAAGVPLAFYVIRQLIGLIPKPRARMR